MLHFWVTTPANLDFFHNQFSMRIIRRLSEDSRRDPPHDTSMGPACQFGYFVQFGSEESCQDLPHVIHEFVSGMFTFHFVIYLARFTFTGFAFSASGKTEEATCIRSNGNVPSPHVMSVLQAAAPRAFGLCMFKANGEFEHVQFVSHNLDRQNAEGVY